MSASFVNEYQAHEKRQPSKKLRRAVKDAFDAEKLIDICTRRDFSPYGERVSLPDGYHGERFYYYQDNGADVLAIAHLDSVQLDSECQVIDTAAGLLAVSGALDDRLGAYVILEMLPKLGVKCDWLLTTDEEIAQSTGEDFDCDFRYNWMFQFDRGGTDVVMYQYETPELCELVKKAGAHVGQGTFSDIVQMDHLECVGLNWGVGYQDYHGPRAHAWLEDTFKQVARFVKFYHANVGTPMGHVPRWKTKKSKDSDAATSWDDVEWIKADCGHHIDVNDPNSYYEVSVHEIVCDDCGYEFYKSDAEKGELQ